MDKTVEYVEKAYSHYDNEEFEETNESCDKSLALLYKLKGNSLMNLDKLKEALNCYENAIQLDPNNASYYYNKGIVLIELEEFTQALDCFEKTLALNPTDIHAQGNKGFILDTLDRYQEAIECYTRAAERDPTNYIWIFNKGNSYESLHNYTLAIDCYYKALSLSPDNNDVKENLKLTLNELSESTASIKEWPKLKEEARKQLSRSDRDFRSNPDAFDLKGHEDYFIKRIGRLPKAVSRIFGCEGEIYQIKIPQLPIEEFTCTIVCHDPSVISSIIEPTKLYEILRDLYSHSESTRYVEQLYSEQKIDLDFSRLPNCSFTNDQSNATLFVTENLPNVQKYLKTKGESALSEHEILLVLLQVAKAIQFIQSKEIVHRDLTPKNLLIDESGRVVLSEFPLAKKLKDLKMPFTDPLIPKGGYLYCLPPEVLKIEAGPDSIINYEKMATWAIGGLIYSLLGVEHPLIDKNYPNSTDEDLSRPSDLNTSVKLSKKFNSFAIELLSHDPEHRPSLEKVIETIEELLFYEPEYKLLCISESELRGWVRWKIHTLIESLSNGFTIEESLLVEFIDRLLRRYKDWTIEPKKWVEGFTEARRQTNAVPPVLNLSTPAISSTSKPQPTETTPLSVSTQKATTIPQVSDNNNNNNNNNSKNRTMTVSSTASTVVKPPKSESPELYPDPIPGQMTYQQLLLRPKGIDLSRMEEYLSDSEFKEIFKVDRHSFAKMPKWKRDNKKRYIRNYKCTDCYFQGC